MNKDKELAAFCLWMLTMPQEEAAAISAAVQPFREDKAKVAVFTSQWWAQKRTR